MRVFYGHSRAVYLAHDMWWHKHRGRASKPDKEVIPDRGVKQGLTVAASQEVLATGLPWPDFGRTTALNVADYCASMNSIPPGQQAYELAGAMPEHSTDLKAGGSNPSAGTSVISQEIPNALNPHWVLGALRQWESYC